MTAADQQRIEDTKIGPMSRTTSDDLCVIRDITQPNAPAIVFLSFK
jgi:hypothetical protein